jgi:hypothetical protein
MEGHISRRKEGHSLGLFLEALAETITFMQQIDEVIYEHGGWPIQ